MSANEYRGNTQKCIFPPSLIRSNTRKINMKRVRQLLISKQNLTQEKLGLVERLDKKEA